MLSSIFSRRARIGALATMAHIVANQPALAWTYPPSQSVEDIITALPSHAFPLGYTGKRSTNFHHLTILNGKSQESPAQSGDPENTTLDSPALQPEGYFKSLETLKAFCPAVPIGRNFDAASFFLKDIISQNAGSMPRGFLEALYFSVSNMNSSTEKREALTGLNKLIPDSPEFVAFMEAKKSELRERLSRDPHLVTAAANWRLMPKEYKEKTLSYVMGMTLTTLLPGKHIEFPKLIVLDQRVLRSDQSYTVNAAYNSEFNEIYLNNMAPVIRDDYTAAVEATVHESFHAFENILANWYARGEIRDPSLARQARFYHISSFTNGAWINGSDNYVGYRTGFKERGSWSFQLAARPANAQSDIASDMFIDRSGGTPKPIAPVPTYRQNSVAGQLPASCLPAIA